MHSCMCLCASVCGRHHRGRYCPRRCRAVSEIIFIVNIQPNTPFAGGCKHRSCSCAKQAILCTRARSGERTRNVCVCVCVCRVCSRPNQRHHLDLGGHQPNNLPTSSGSSRTNGQKILIVSMRTSYNNRTTATTAVLPDKNVNVCLCSLCVCVNAQRLRHWRLAAQVCHCGSSGGRLACVRVFVCVFLCLCCV